MEIILDVLSVIGVKLTHISLGIDIIVNFMRSTVSYVRREIYE